MLCRLCLKSDTTLHSIISSESKCAELTLIESIYWIFGVEVDVNDPYSKLICGRCENVVQYVGSYRSLYRRNQLILEGKLDNYYQYDELVDEMNLTINGGNEQFRNTTTTKDTSNESELSPKAKRRRLKLINYYYEIPTTSIRELIGYQKLKDTKNDEASLFQVNEIVNVEVCKFCSEIFTTKRLLDFHYKTKHKSSEKKALRFKRLKRTRKSFFTKKCKKMKNIFYKSETSKRLLDIYPSIKKQFDKDNRPKNFLSDVKNFPNLNYVKQFHTYAKTCTASKITAESKAASLSNQPSNACQDNGKNDCVINTIDNGSCHNDNTEVKTTEKIKAIEMASNLLLTNDQNRENMRQYNRLNLKDFYICLERCAVPTEFYSDQTVAQKINSSNTDLEKPAFPESTLATENTDGRAVAYESNENMGMMNSDNESDVQILDNYSEGKIGSVLMKHNKDTRDICFSDCLSKNKENQGIKDRYQTLNLSDVYVSIQRCDDKPTKFKQTVRLETTKLRKMKKWKDHISESLLKLQYITFDKNEVSNQNTGVDFAYQREDNSETIVSTSLKDVTPTDFDSRPSEDSINEIQTIKLSGSYISEDDVRDQYKQLRLKDFYISLKRCPVPNGFYQRKGTLQQKTSSILIKSNEDKKINSINELSITPEKSKNWKTNLLDSLLKINEINNWFQDNQPPHCNAGSSKQNEPNFSENQSESTVNKKEPMRKNYETPQKEVSHEHINQMKSVSSESKKKRKRRKERDEIEERKNIEIHTSKQVTSLNKPDNLPKMRDMAVIIPNIDIFLRNKGYNDEIYGSVDISRGIDSQQQPTVSNGMPQLEKEPERKENHQQDISDEPPKLELQVQKSPLVKTITTPKKVLRKRACSRISKTSVVTRNKIRRLNVNTEPTNSGVIQNIVNTEKDPIALESKPCKLKKKVRLSPVATKEMRYITTGVEQLTNLLNSMEIEGNGDNDWANKRFNLCGELPVNNWNEKIFSKLNDLSDHDSLDRNLLMEEETFPNDSLIRDKFSVGVDDEDGNKIKEKDDIDLHKEQNDGQNSKCTKNGNVQNDACLTAKEVEDIPGDDSNKIEDNASQYLDKEGKDDKHSKPSEKGIIENDTYLNPTMVEGIFQDDMNKTENSVTHHLDKEQREDNSSKSSEKGTIKDDGIPEDDINKIKEKIIPRYQCKKEKRGRKSKPSKKDKNIESTHKNVDCIPDSSSIDDDREMKIWKKQISNVLLKLKQITDDNSTEQENSESLNTLKTVSTNNTTGTAKNIIEIHKNDADILEETTSSLNVAEQSASSIKNTVSSSQHEDLVKCIERSREQSNVLESDSKGISSPEVNESLELTTLSDADKNNKCEISADDFDKNTCNIKSIIKSRWSNITKGKTSISEALIPSSSSVDLQNFAHSIVKKQSQKK